MSITYAYAIYFNQIGINYKSTEINLLFIYFGFFKYINHSKDLRRHLLEKPINFIFTKPLLIFHYTIHDVQ